MAAARPSPVATLRKLRRRIAVVTRLMASPKASKPLAVVSGSGLNDEYTAARQRRRYTIKENDGSVTERRHLARRPRHAQRTWHAAVFVACRVAGPRSCSRAA